MGAEVPRDQRRLRSVWEQVPPFFVLRLLGADPQGDLHDERAREPEQRGVARALHARTREHLSNDRAAAKLSY